MKKLLFILLFSIFSLHSKSQHIFYQNKIKNENGIIYLTIYDCDSIYTFGFDFFELNRCQNKVDIYLLMEGNNIIKIKHRNIFTCNKSGIYFDIDTSKINIYDIRMIRYYNLSSMEQFNFKIKK